MILVIDWNRFIDEINLDYLSDADFCYRIWTYDRDGNDRIIPVSYTHLDVYKRQK